jgi:hypothetical protein
LGEHEGLGEAAGVVRRVESLTPHCILATVSSFLDVTPIVLYTLLFIGMAPASSVSIRDRVVQIGV